MTSLPGVSIVIANYNYERFLGDAIESALAQTHPGVEVIVVDDGSTDGSRAVIDRYGDKVQAIFQPNAGQIRACARGFEAVRHDIVIFLDADDRLMPEAAASVARHWRPDLAKLQFRMRTIDGTGRPTGHDWPKYPPTLTAATCLDELLRSGSYPAPPTSGNAYGRRLIEGAWPLEGHLFVDSVLNTVAPLYGDVDTIHDVLACYRIHGSNNWAQQALTAERFAYYARSEHRRMEVLAHHCRRLGIAFDGPQVIERSIYLREVELVRAKLTMSAQKWPGSALAPAGRAALAAMRQPQAPWHRLLRAAWALALGFAPSDLAMKLIAFRFVQAERPRIAEKLINGIRPRTGGKSPIADEMA